MDWEKRIEYASSENFATRQKALDEVLRSLAMEQFQIEPSKEYKVFFCALYRKCGDRRFRHRYASIYRVILSCASPDGKVGANEVAEALANNLEAIKKQLDDSDSDAKLGLFKLIDHVNIEAQRLVRDTAQSSQQTEALRNELRRMHAEMFNLRNSQMTLQTTIANQQRDYVTILSVFAAIIIAFGTGTGFAVSAVGAVIPKGSVALICFVVSVVGLVLFNALFVLFEFLYRLLRRGQPRNTANPRGILGKRTFIGINVAIVVIVLVFGILSYANPMYSTTSNEETSSPTQQPCVLEESSQ